MRALFAIAAISLFVGAFAQRLLATREPWAVTLAILVCGGGLVTCALVLRQTRDRVPRRRERLPRDPGIPRDSHGDPYRGPR